MQEKCSVRFTLSILAHCDQMQSIIQNLIVHRQKICLAEVESSNFFTHNIFVWTLEPRNVFEVAWQISSWLMSIGH